MARSLGVNFSGDVLTKCANIKSDAKSKCAFASNVRQIIVTRRRRWLPRIVLKTATAMIAIFGLIGPAAGQAEAPIDTVPLGLASTYGALTPAGAFASTGATTLLGDTGSSTYAFAPEGEHIGNALTTASPLPNDYLDAAAAVETAYSNAENRPAGTLLAPNISGLTVLPGVHTNGAAVGSTAATSFTIDGGGDPDAVFIFQINAALSLGANFEIILTGEAQAKNVFWQINGAATIGANSIFKGTILANGAISSGANSMVDGRLLTKMGAISVDINDLDFDSDSGAVPPVALGSASTFGALSLDGTFASTGATKLRGDTGSSTYVFAPEGAHIGYALTPASPLPNDYSDAVAAVETAYSNAENRPAGTSLAPNISGLTVLPGVHTYGAAVASTANTFFTIDGGGDPDAVFIFQIGDALSLGANFEIVLTGEAQAKNVFWQINGAATIGADSIFKGTILANGPISSGANSMVDGRLLTKMGAISVDINDLDFDNESELVPARVSIDGGTVAASTVSNPQISGVTSVVSPEAVTVTIDGNIQMDQPVPAADGTWTLTLDGILSEGAHTIVATVTDGGSFTQILTVNILQTYVVPLNDGKTVIFDL
jgi:hypothetical protein